MLDSCAPVAGDEPRALKHCGCRPTLSADGLRCSHKQQDESGGTNLRKAHTDLLDVREDYMKKGFRQRNRMYTSRKWGADMAISRSICAFLVLLSASISLQAQWLNYPTPGIPRT